MGIRKSKLGPQKVARLLGKNVRTTDTDATPCSPLEEDPFNNLVVIGLKIRKILPVIEQLSEKCKIGDLTELRRLIEEYKLGPKEGELICEKFLEMQRQRIG